MNRKLSLVEGQRLCKTSRDGKSRKPLGRNLSVFRATLCKMTVILLQGCIRGGTELRNVIFEWSRDMVK